MSFEYEYEVFVSYRRDEAVKNWLRFHFVPELRSWLPQYLPPGHPSRIFIDWDLRPGQKWPSALRRNLVSSRCLLPVFTTQYFASDWCMAELRSMQAREELLGIGVNDNSDGLVFPIVFADGKRFPDDVSRLTQRIDMTQWAYDNESFRDTREYTYFITSVTEVAESLAEFILRAPDCQDWPVKTPELAPRSEPVYRMVNPRFGGTRI